MSIRLTTPQATLLNTQAKTLLSARSFPKTLCPSEIARALSQHDLQQLNAAHWRDTMPQVRHVLWQMRENGEVDFLQGGRIVEASSLEDVYGPLRVRAKQKLDWTRKVDE